MAIVPAPIGTASGARAGMAEVTAATPDAMDTATVRM
jgi:hypothetical protein